MMYARYFKRRGRPPVDTPNPETGRIPARSRSLTRPTAAIAAALPIAFLSAVGCCYAAAVTPRPVAESQLDAYALVAAPVMASDLAAVIASDSEYALFLQVAAFGREQNARSLQRRLEDGGIDKVVLIANLEGVPVYRVRIGPLTNTDEYARMVERLDEAGITGALLVKTEQPVVSGPAAIAVIDERAKVEPPERSARISQPEPIEQFVRIEQAEPIIQAEMIAQAEPNVLVEPIEQAEPSIQTEAITRAEPIAEAETIQPSVRMNRLERPTRLGEAAAESGIRITRSGGEHSAAIRRLMLEGMSDMRAGRYGAAEIKFRQVLISEPDLTRASGYLFALLSDQGRVDAADSVALAGLAEGSDVSPLAMLYARTLLDRGDADAALRVLEDHRPASSGDSGYDELLAALLQMASRHQEAARTYEQLLRLDQRVGDWWAGLGIAEDSLGNQAKALYAFQRARDTSRMSVALANYTAQRIAELQAYE